MKFGKRIPRSLGFILSVYGLGIVFFTLFRVILLIVAKTSLKDVPPGIVAESLLMGWRFDTVISGYLLVLPATIVLLGETFGFLKTPVLKGVNLFLGIVYSLAFLICASDIPYFLNYNSRINIGILNWTDSPKFVARMIFEDTGFLLFFLLFVAAAFVFSLLLRNVYRKYRAVTQPVFPLKARLAPGLVIWVLVTGLLILGIRGRTDEKSPIMPGTAYFSSYDLPNQAGLNPVFTFMWSYLDGLKDENKPVHLADDQQSIAYVRNALHITGPVPKGGSPLLRTVHTGQPLRMPNVVVVLMESMSADYLARFGDTRNLTPNLDSLASKGYSFNSFYSAGLHTFNGIFSSLYSFPAIMARHTMVGATINHFSGLPWLLRSRGYKTAFFTTHDDQFDNMGGFLAGNNFEQVYSKKDYGAAEIVSTLGVPDHVQFRRALPRIAALHQTGKPFFAAFMTVSNHNPFYVPSDVPLKPNHEDVRGGTVEYADWAIGDFMQQASRQPWYTNTIFVFLGDHGTFDGASIGGLPFGYNHIPCIIYSPMLDGHKDISSPGGQIDLFPTVAGILGGEYQNNTLGIDLLRESRPCMYFGQDDKIAVVDNSDLYFWNTDGSEHMFELGTKQDVLSQKRLKADSMKQYAFNMVQCYQWLLNNKLVGPAKN